MENRTNNNYGSCLNYIINSVDTPYIKILDVDDVFYVEFLDSIIAKMKSNLDLDLIITNFNVLNLKTNKERTVKLDGFFPKKESHFSWGSVSASRMPLTHHAMFFNKLLLKRISVQVREKIGFTDVSFIYFILNHVVTFAFYPNDIVYCYRISNAEQTSSLVSMVKRKSEIRTVISDIIRYSANIEIAKPKSV